MSKVVPPEKVKALYRFYEKYESYAEVAQITGWSTSTIGKYICMAGITKPIGMRWDRRLGDERLNFNENCDII